jgi:hypothetical protein
MPVLELPAQRRPRHDHVVHVYRSEAALVGCVHAFLAPGLDGREAALVVATPERRAMLADSFAQGGADVGLLRADGRYVDLDAEDTLDSFSVDGRIDPGLFARTIGGRLRAMLAGHGRVRVFGEMVARLWERGQAAEALELEHLWNGLALQLPFRLCCAYPEAVVSSIGTVGQLEEMLRAHTASSHV